MLDFLAAMGTLPYALTRVLTLPNLEGRAQAHLEDGTLTISPIRVTSGTTEVLASTSIGRTVEAAMMIHSGLISMGLGIADKHVTVHPFDGQALLDSSPRASRKSLNADPGPAPDRTPDDSARIGRKRPPSP